MGSPLALRSQDLLRWLGAERPQEPPSSPRVAASGRNGSGGPRRRKNLERSDREEAGGCPPRRGNSSAHEVEEAVAGSSALETWQEGLRCRAGRKVPWHTRRRMPLWLRKDGSGWPRGRFARADGGIRTTSDQKLVFGHKQYARETDLPRCRRLACPHRSVTRVQFLQVAVRLRKPVSGWINATVNRACHNANCRRDARTCSSEMTRRK
jgi:hypothetical protein